MAQPSMRPIGDIFESLKALINREVASNDREFVGSFSEGIMALASGRIPPGDPNLLLGNNLMIELLFNTLPHPTTHIVGGVSREACNTSSSWGQANTPYALNVNKTRADPSSTPDLPDPGLVFDKLLGRQDQSTITNHPGGNSSMTFAFASLVTHSIFFTDRPPREDINKTASFLDLSPLYGSNQTEQDAVRLKDGTGRLHPDTFSEGRLAFLPPASGALLVIWNRNHNYIARRILEIDSSQQPPASRRGWSNPPPVDDDKRKQQDDDIFETARRVNCGSFMSVIMNDYVAGFLGLIRSGSTWAMKPFDPFTGVDGKEVSRGEGNHVSVEFNILYRWHAISSEKDEAWTCDIFKSVFDKPHNKLTMEDLNKAFEKLAARPAVEPRKRNFAGIQRDADGRFSDADLARILHDSTEGAARRFGARGSPGVLRVIEIMGINQSRNWGMCTMNEFRKFLGLKQFTTFEEWNSDTTIASAAKELYHDINNLELYPGLHAEETMSPKSSGLCAGHTVTRGILSDAIALVRGDSAFTKNLTPDKLTPWGMNDIARNPNNGAFGAYLPKLLLRHLPRHYGPRSVYTLFPFFTPSVARQNLEALHRAGRVNLDDFDFTHF